jgi:hypothetical protein
VLPNISTLRKTINPRSTKGGNAVGSWVYKGVLVLFMIVFRDNYVSLTLSRVKLVRLSEN